MAPSPTLSDRGGVNAPMSIYEAPGVPASERRPVVRARAAATGFALGAASWVLISILGVAQIFGIDPFTGLIPFAVGGALFGLTRFGRVLVWASAALAGLLVVLAYTDIASGPARRLIRSDALPPSADAIVVLSAGVTTDGLLPQQGSDRLMKGLELARARVAPVLVITREQTRVDEKVVTSAGDQDRFLTVGGIQNVIFAGPVKSTRQEALVVASIGRQRGWRRLVVVTSPFHSSRACRTFEKVGMMVSCVPSDSRDIAVRTLVTPGDRVSAFGMWIYEVAGTLRYRWAGWI